MMGPLELKIKRQHNASLTLSKLPTEVLSYVFELVGNAGANPNRTHQFKWVQISHIFSHWRQVALSCSRPWREITLNAPVGWVQELLYRSKKTLLVVEVDLQHPFIPDITRVWAHIPRISHLLIKGSQSHGSFHPKAPLARTLLPHIPYLADSLDSLILRLVVDDTMPVTVCLPVNIFAGGTPRLRYLELHNCDLVWELSVAAARLPSLTTLILESSSKIPSMSVLMSALKNMPNLDNLYLDGNVPDIDDLARTSASDRVPLLISGLTIRNACIIDSLFILNQFTFPRLCYLSLELKGTHESDLESMKNIFLRLYNDEGFGSRCPIRCMEASFFALEELRTSIQAADVDNDTLQPDILDDLLISLQLPGQQPVHVFQSLVMVLPLQNLRAFTLGGLRVVDWAMLGQLRSLEHLSIDEYELSDELNEALITVRQSVMYFTALRSLTLFGWSDDAGNTSLDGLIDAMAKRRDNQIPPPKITLDVRMIAGDEEEKLREVVECLVLEYHPDKHFFTFSQANEAANE